MIQIHNSATIFKDFEVALHEASGVIAEFQNERAIIVVIYVPLRVNKWEFVLDFDKVLERLASYHHPITICSDFNIDIRKQDKLASEYQSDIASNYFTILSDLPTRITESSNSCIDHFILKDFHNPSIKIKDKETISDHFLNYLQYFQNRIHEPNKYTFRDMSFPEKELLNQFCNELSSALAETKFITNDNVEQSFTLSKLFE